MLFPFSKQFTAGFLSRIDSDLVMFLISMNVGSSFMFSRIKLLFLRTKNVVVGRKTEKD